VSAPRGTRRIDLYQRDPRQAFTDFVTGTERSDPQASVPVFTIRVVQPGEYLVVAWQSDERQVGASAEQSRVHQLLTVGEGDPPVLEFALGPE